MTAATVVTVVTIVTVATVATAVTVVTVVTKIPSLCIYIFFFLKIVTKLKTHIVTKLKN